RAQPGGAELRHPVRAHPARRDRELADVDGRVRQRDLAQGRRLGRRGGDHGHQRAPARARGDGRLTMPALPTAAEDYVKVIYSHTEWQPVPISSTGLAARLGLAASSV